MSSKSQMEISSFDIVIVGGGWPAAVACHYLLSEGAKVAVVDGVARPGGLPLIYRGLGDVYGRSALAFGPSLATELWALSSKNIARAESLFSLAGASWEAIPVSWAGSPSINPKVLNASLASGFYQNENHPLLGDCLMESGISFDPADLLARLCALQRDRVERIAPAGVAFDKQGADDIVALLLPSGEVRLLKATFLLLLDDLHVLEFCPSMASELIPVTLAAFHEPLKVPMENRLMLFQGGADFCFAQSQTAQVGSFRNLFEDKAVGHFGNFDVKSWQGVSRFFSELGWIEGRSEPSRVEFFNPSVTCDGLPLVGPVRESPTVFTATGFNGRQSNFLFEALFQIARAMVSGEPLEAPFTSNKRFL